MSHGVLALLARGSCRDRLPGMAKTALCLLLFCLSGLGAAEPPTSAVPGLTYREVVRDQPRPLRMHILTADLTQPTLELAMAIAADPDGPGPAEAQLSDPHQLITDHGMLAAVNANAFSSLTPRAGDPNEGWSLGQPVDLCGLASTPAAPRRSADHRLFTALWSDGTRMRIGHPPANAQVVIGCAGFDPTMRGGMPVRRGDHDLHPRTAVGIDQAGTFLWLLVVDGRQPGVSEGMSKDELGLFMHELGCHDALNLDGGGGSVLMLRDQEDRPRFQNRPGTVVDGVHVPRPTPTLLGVRRRAAAPGE